MNNEAQLQDTLQLNPEDLYEQLGREISSGLALDEADSEELAERGTRWFAQKRQMLQEKICTGYVATTVLEKGQQWDRLLLLASIADLISALSLGVSPVTVAALIVKEGLLQFCKKPE